MILVILLTGCVFVSADDHAARKALAVSDSGVVDTDTDSDSDTDIDSDEDTDAGNPWAGEYTGTFSLTLDDGILEPEDCDGTAEIAIDAAGRVSGSVVCERTSGGTIEGTVAGTAAGSEAAGTLVLEGDLEDNSGWSGFLVDTRGGTLTGTAEGTAEGGLLNGTDYSSEFEGSRGD